MKISMHPLRMAATENLVVAARSYRAAADKALADLGLSQATAWPIALAGRMGNGMRQGALAEALGVEGPSLVRVVDQLVAADLMRRQEDPSDRRAKTLHLTEAGEAQRARIETLLETLRQQVFEGVGEEDLQGFVRVMQAVRRNLGRRAGADEERA